MTAINRLRAMALNAIRAYHAEALSGGEPSYPQWADDMLEVCQLAEPNTEVNPPQHSSEALQ